MHCGWNLLVALKCQDVIFSLESAGTSDSGGPHLHNLLLEMLPIRRYMGSKGFEKKKKNNLCKVKKEIKALFGNGVENTKRSAWRH